MARQVKQSEITKNIASRLQSLRKDKGLTLEQLAFEADMELTQVRRVLHGHHDAQVTTVQKLVKVLG